MSLEELFSKPIRTAKNDTRYHAEPSFKSIKMAFQNWINPNYNINARLRDTVYWTSVFAYRLTTNLFSKKPKPQSS